MRLIDRLVFVQQPCGTSCVSACLAMALNTPVNEVIDEFHAPYHALETGLSDYFDLHGVTYECFWSDDRRRINKDGVYFLTVPSLNAQAENHQILGVFEDGSFWVVDPNRGKSGKLWYVPGGVPAGEFEVNIKGFVIDFLIPAEYYQAETIA